MNLYRKLAKCFPRRADLGFTLLELLIVTSIIGVLSSVIVVPIHLAREKGRDTHKEHQLTEIRTALEIFFNKYGKYPSNYSQIQNGWENPPTFVPGGMDTGQANQVGACDGPLPNIPGGGEGSCQYCDRTTLINPEAFQASMQELVDAGVLSAVPKSVPNGPGLCYRRECSVSAGCGKALLVTTLESVDPSTTGYPGTCRPRNFNNNSWCENGRLDSSYCLCIGNW